MLLTDQRPYYGKNDRILLEEHQRAVLTANHRQAGGSRVLEAVCLRAMALDPCKRYDGAATCRGHRTLAGR